MSAPGTKLWIYAGLAATGVGFATLVLTGRPKVKRGTKVFLLGDSLAIGLSTPLKALAKDAGVTFSSLAKSGTRFDNWDDSKELAAALLAFKPDIILVSLGTNDEYLYGDGGTKQQPHLDVLLTNLRALAPVLWIGPPTLPKAGTNGVIPRILEAVPSSHYFPSQNYTIPRGPDKLHPTTLGYAQWAGTLWKWLT